MTTPIRVAAGLLSALVAVGGLTACSGDDGGSTAAPWSDAGAKAKELLDGTSGIEVSLSTGDDPGTDYLSAASGTIVADPPAFEGSVAGRVSGFEASSIDVVSVDGTLWIDAPIIGWTDKYQPEALCAPDPAELLDPSSGVSSVLTSSTGVKAGKSERGGKDNKEIFHTYAGTATGDSIRKILPCAEGDAFEATYRVDDSGYLRTARLTGTFFPDSEPMTYTIDVTAYDVEKDISAPR
ncbi:LppX_LprAFG lipoprotein [Nocardioides daeguensis]|uniref:LppX_LprAFG lipoprotein n=1 Tax=Nocardioides daeguensis TaxID=908359 RepID=A0ABP6VSJ6_9ACTN|nr:LppX_LprAFG lipoprotein [Nocardioides daeguensis]MBV6727563.1 LppX_LprAFG lipoprotein [Nocardioides daeguensis]MCR1773215.1 LppX_LprAFG lipoprotein [Nocardioides daeguensis]